MQIQERLGMRMQGKNKQKRKSLLTLVLCAAMCITLLAGTGLSVQAGKDDFEIEAVKLATDEETFNIQVTVENLGEDWEGSVRLIVDEEYMAVTAFDTVISLPEDSVKQFVVNVPRMALENSDGTVNIYMVDKKSKIVAEEKFKNLLREEDDMLAMGILSDNYADLTFMDMGGYRLYYYRDNLAVKLSEVTKDTLLDDLDSLVFLVIDSYNTEILTEEQILAIEAWVNDGGVLIMGTGAYGEEVLKGFEDSFLGVTCEGVFEPGVSKYELEYGDESRLHFAQLRDEYGQFYNYATGAMICSYGDGAAGVLSYSLAEVGGMDMSFFENALREDFVLYILEDISSYSNSRYDSSMYYSNYNNKYDMRRMLGYIGSNNSPLNLNVLKVLVVAYVIFAGPVLYIILRLCKKREWYWYAVPVSAFLGVLLISLAGRGFEVVDTRAYTITAQNLGGNKERETVLYCFDAEHKEWSLKLTPGYDYASSFYSEYYNYNGSPEDGYYHHFVKEGDVLSIGLNPSANFEDSFFIAVDKNSDTSGMGHVNCFGIADDWASPSGLVGSVTNETAYDFPYFAVIDAGTLCVFEELKAGDSCNLAKTTPLYKDTQNYDLLNNYLYDCIRTAYNDEDEEALTALSALGVGIGTIYKPGNENATIVIGLVENWEKIVDDDCSEMSFGCLYEIQ